MVDLMATGAYDGVSASGDATLRLIARGDVAPVNTELTPNYEDVFDGLKDQSYNSVDGVPYGVPHGRGPNYMVFRNDDPAGGHEQLGPVWDGSQARASCRSTTARSSSPTRRVYLKATQPDLDITDPYQLTRSSSTLRSTC